MSTITFAPQISYHPRSVRLMRRGRLVVFAVGVLLAFSFGVWFAAGSVATHEAGVEQVEVVTVARARPCGTSPPTPPQSAARATRATWSPASRT